MLTMQEVVDYADIYQSSTSLKFRLCYLKDGKLCRLSYISSYPDWQEFLDFVNNQEDLTLNQLTTYNQWSKDKTPLGSYSILENGDIRRVDVAGNVAQVRDTICEAVLKLKNFGVD